MKQCQMSKLKVQMKSKAQSGKHRVLDLPAKGKNTLTLSHLSFV